MGSTGSYLLPPGPPGPPQLWATLTKHYERIVDLTQEDYDDEIDELAGDEGRHGIRPILPVHMLVILPHHLWTLEGIAMGPPPKILFDFELDNTRVPMVAPGVVGWSAHSSTVVTILDVFCILR